MKLKRGMGIGNATKLTVLTEIQLVFFMNHSLNCYKYLVNFQSTEKVDFDKCCQLFQ